MNETPELSSVRKTTLLGSGAGLIAAICIIIIFILAVTFFKSVIFGLLLAYLFLPLQGWYKKLMQNKIFYRISIVPTIIFSPVVKPLRAYKNKIMTQIKHSKNSNLSEEEVYDKHLVSRSCKLTMLTVFILFIFLIYGAFWLSTSYITSATHSISVWAQQTATSYHEERNRQEDKISPDESKNGTIQNLTDVLSYKLEEIKPKLEKFEAYKVIQTFVAGNLNSPESAKAIIDSIQKKAGGIFSYTAGALGTFLFLIINTVFTFFFFAFFLSKLASINASNKKSSGQYISETILNSAWFPQSTENTKNKSAEILDNILLKLRIWLRGYCIIIIIETIFYSTVFSLLGVPFGLILGLIAGCTILLPYLGPIVSAILTIIISLTLGDMSMTRILLLLLSYILMTGILDQLFIYPAVVGSALGLNELETIVVVLLGGMLFGITGMIFAVPTVSILKYLIPEIYKLIDEFNSNKHSRDISKTS